MEYKLYLVNINSESYEFPKNPFRRAKRRIWFKKKNSSVFLPISELSVDNQRDVFHFSVHRVNIHIKLTSHICILYILSN